MRTISIKARIGEALVGTAKISSRFQAVQIGRSIPSVHTPEDAEALVRCLFLDVGTPVEFNLTEARAIQNVLLRKKLESFAEPQMVSPEHLLSGHSSLGYLPPEVLNSPNSRALRQLGLSGPVGSEIARLWLNKVPSATAEVLWSDVRSGDLVGTGAFWERIVEDRSRYTRFFSELLTNSQRLRVSSFAPPVPVVSARYVQSARVQSEVNLAAAQIMSQVVGPNREVSMLYSLHVDPSSLEEDGLLRQARQLADDVLTNAASGFHGIHLHFTNLGSVSLSGGLKVRTASDLVRALSATARSHGIYLWVSDVGPAAPAFLDDGAAFASYSLGGSTRPIYSIFKGLPEESTPTDRRRYFERRFGKTLGGPWDYNLLTFSEVRKREWKVQENGKFSNVVPIPCRHTSPERYRVEFGKPNNVAVMERLNEERETELLKRRNAKAGKSAVGRSSDAQIGVWA